MLTYACRALGKGFNALQPLLLRSLSLCLATLLLIPGPAPAQDTSRCYSIRDNDRKNMCLALARRDASACYSIRDNDDKNMCLAQVRGQRSNCYSIRDNDQKNQCLAMVR
ncbi:MAG: hypothetical protein ACK51Y_04425 [Burkholderiales bacterium]